MVLKEFLFVLLTRDDAYCSTCSILSAGKDGCKKKMRILVNLIPKIKKLEVDIHGSFSYQFRYELGTAIVRNLKVCDSLCLQFYNCYGEFFMLLAAFLLILENNKYQGNQSDYTSFMSSILKGRRERQGTRR